MPEIEDLGKEADKVIQAIQELTSRDWRDGVVRADIVTGGGMAELEEIRIQTEDLRRRLHALERKSKIDPEVMDVERKLDEALSRYYWLWLKWKDSSHH